MRKRSSTPLNSKKNNLISYPKTQTKIKKMLNLVIQGKNNYLKKSLFLLLLTSRKNHPPIEIHLEAQQNSFYFVLQFVYFSPTRFLHFGVLRLLQLAAHQTFGLRSPSCQLFLDGAIQTLNFVYLKARKSVLLLRGPVEIIYEFPKVSLCYS